MLPTLVSIDLHGVNISLMAYFGCVPLNAHKVREQVVLCKQYQINTFCLFCFPWDYYDIECNYACKALSIARNLPFTRKNYIFLTLI